VALETAGLGESELYASRMKQIQRVATAATWLEGALRTAGALSANERL